MRGRACLLVPAVIAALAKGAAAQPPSPVDPLIGRPVTSITLEAEGHPVTGAGVAGLLQTAVGRPLAIADVRESVFHLASVGRFDQVEVDGRPEGGGVALTYRLVETRRITQVRFRGDLGVAARRLRQALGNRASGTATPERLRSAEGTLSTFYTAEGYFTARVDATVDDVPDPYHSRAVFTVQAGPRYRVGQLEVTARGALSRADVLARLDLRPGQPWEAPRLEQRVRRYVERLRAEGFYEATVRWDLARHDDTASVDVTVEADSGPRVELVFESGDMPASRLREFVPIEREGSVDEDLLEDSKRRIERWLATQGYWRGTVDYERTQLADRLRLVFRVTHGALYEVERMDLTGVSESRLPEVRALVRLRPGVPFVEETLRTDASRIEEYYRVRGFVNAHVEALASPVAGRRAPGGQSLVDARLVVTEGERVTVDRIVIDGASAVSEAALRQMMGLKPGGPYYPPQLVADRNAVEAYYTNRGFRDARVDAMPRASAVPQSLDVVYEITEGAQHLVGHVLVAGNTRTSDGTILRELMLTPGEALGTDALVEAQRRLSALGLFRRVRLEELHRPGGDANDVMVTVEEAPATNIGYGVGLEGGRRLVSDPAQGDAAVEKLEISPRGFFEVGRRNLWGKNRSISLFTRLSLRNRGGGGTDPTTTTTAFYEYRVVGTYREPRLFGTAADGQITGFMEQGVRSSFNFGRRGVNAEAARRVGRALTAVGRYTFGSTKLFDERFNPADKPLIDRLYPQVRLSILTGVLVEDTRNDPLDPTRGHLFNLQGDLAARALGSEVGYAKSFVQGFLYRRLPGTDRLVFAGGARLGLATAFGNTTVTDASGAPIVVDLQDLPASERFYAGGSTTVRGYALDRLGDDKTIDSNGFPLGGNALVIFNAELRFPVWRSVGGVAFLDAGNVFAQTTDLDLGRIRTAAGWGVRYKSPVGPIRVDVGFKLQPRTFATGETERRWEVHVSLGQAF